MDIEGIKSSNKTYQIRLTGVGLQSRLKLIAGDFFKDENEHSIILASSYVKGLGFKDSLEAVGKEVILQSRGGYRGEGTALKPVKPLEVDYNEPRADKKQENYYKEQEEKNNQIKTYLKAKIIGIAADSPGYEGQSLIPIGWAKKMNARIDWNYKDGELETNISDATRMAIRRLFTFEAAAIGFAGGAVGILLTLLLRLVGNYFLNGVLEGQGIETLNVITVPFWLMAGVVLFTTLLGISAGFLPAQKAARMDPVEALRYE